MRLFSCVALMPLVAALFVPLAIPLPALAQRPSAAELLPDATVAYFRIANANELRDRLRQTALGKVGDDPEVKPLVTKLYGSTTAAFSQFQDQVGASLDELLDLPRGEIAFAAIASKQTSLQLVLLVDVGDRMPQALRMLAKGELALAERGAEKSTETFENTLVTTFKLPNRPNASLSFCERQGAILITSHAEALRDTLARWSRHDANPNKSSEKSDPDSLPLSKNRKFNSVMNRCAPAKGENVQLSWFIDPIAGVKAGLRGNLAAQTGLALLPVLGLDGLQAAGGSVLLATDEFDLITNVHLLLDNPRNGVLELLAMRGGESTPEPWVPSDSASYLTLHWDLPATWRSLVKLVDSFQGEGWLSGEVKKNISGKIGADFEAEILPLLGSRVSTFSCIEKPARLNSRSSTIGIQIIDAKALAPLLEKIASGFPDQIETKSHAGLTYYRSKKALERPRPRPRNTPNQNDDPSTPNTENNPPLVPQFPCLAILGDYLLFANRESSLHRAIDSRNNPSQGLAKQLDFKLIASKIRHYLGGEQPGMILFDRPEEGLKLMYDLVTGETAQRRLERAAESNEFARSVQSALKEHPLPPFAVVAKYLAPSGGMVVSDETGFHYTGFTLKRK